MAKFLTTRGTTSEIENIINGAKQNLVLISPFIKMPEGLFQNLKSADKRRVNITIVYGKGELDPAVINQLKQLDYLSLYYHDKLHAKCYYNEGCMVITSMNFYDYSELNNREMGILFNIQSDTKIYNDAINEAKRIIEFSERIPLTKSDFSNHNYAPRQIKEKQAVFNEASSEAIHGHCIRCETNIPLDPSKPYCRKCFDVWKKWEDPDHKEKYCHMCGTEKATTFDYPLCRTCYKKLR